MQRFIFLIFALLIIVFTLAHTRNQPKMPPVTSPANTPLSAITATYNRPPLGELIYSSDGRYAADISVHNLYLFDTQRDSYLPLNNSINPLGFSFNDDNTLLVAFGCNESIYSHYCSARHIILWDLTENGATLHSRLDDVPLARITSIRFVNIYNTEFIAAYGCKQIDEAILGLCYPQNANEVYWSLSSQKWLVLS